MIFTIHARDRMRERGITEREAEEALSNVHAVTPGNAPTMLYVYVREEEPVSSSVEIDAGRAVDLDETERAVGIEVLGASRGVRLVDLIERFHLEDLRQSLQVLESTRFSPIEFA